MKNDEAKKPDLVVFNEETQKYETEIKKMEEVRYILVNLLELKSLTQTLNL